MDEDRIKTCITCKNAYPVIDNLSGEVLSEVYYCRLDDDIYDMETFCDRHEYDSE